MSKKPKFFKMYSPSADVIGGNEDFLNQILPHLPAKSLSRFKSVSKQWRVLISDRNFGLIHACKNPSSSIPYGIFFYNPLLRDLYFCNHFSADESNNSVFSSNDELSGKIPACPDHSIYSISLSRSGPGSEMPSCSDPDDVSIQMTTELLPGQNKMKMVQSCNGLNLFQFNTLDERMKLYCVRNLATNQLKMIPFPKLYDNHRIVTCNLAFDPLASPHYKIVCVKQSGILTGSRILIYSSETGQWKDTSNVPTIGWSVEFAKGVHCQGAIYWVVNDFLSCYCYRFDVEAEKLTKISMPACPRGAILSFKYFGEFNGRLHLICSRSLTKKMFNIYELDQVTLKWFVKNRVHINHLFSPFPEILVKGVNNDSQSAFSILCVVSVAKDDDSSLVMTIPGKVVSYNLKSKRAEVLSELPSLKTMNFHGSNAYPFVPTLYPL